MDETWPIALRELPLHPLWCCGGHWGYTAAVDGSGGLLWQSHDLWCALDLSAPLT